MIEYELFETVGKNWKSINLYYDTQEKFLTIGLNTLTNYLKYGYSMIPKKEDNFYNFDVGFYLSGLLILQIRIIINGLFILFELNEISG